MRTQRDKGYSEIRVPKPVGHVPNGHVPESGSSSPKLPLPIRPKDKSRPSSPASRPIPSRRYTEDEDWSQQPRYPSPPEHIADERSYSPSPRRPSLPSHPTVKSPVNDSSLRRKPYDNPSPLAFGARGVQIKIGTQDPPAVPVKAEKREKIKIGERGMKKGYGEDERRVDPNGVGLGIRGHGINERVGRV